MPAYRVAETQVRVRFADTDAQGVAYYGSYLVWFEVGRVEYLRQMGMRYADLERAGLGVTIAEATCRYHAPAYFDDLLTIRTWCDRIGRTSFRFHYELKRAGDDILVAEGATVQVMLDAESQRPAPIPPILLAWLEPLPGDTGKPDDPGDGQAHGGLCS